MISGCCARPLQNSLLLSLLKRCFSTNARNLTYALQSFQKMPQVEDLDDKLITEKQQELLHTLSSVRAMKEIEEHLEYIPIKDTSLIDYWHRKSEMQIPVRLEEDSESSFVPNILLEKHSIPQILWHDSANEDQAYWEQQKQKQLELEQSFVDEALLEFKRNVAKLKEKDMIASLPAVRGLLFKWMHPLSDAIKTHQQKMFKSGISPGRMGADQLLVLLNADELAVITIHTVLGCVLKGSDDEKVNNRASFTSVVFRVGKAVQAQLNLLKLKQKVESENKRRKMLNRYVAEIKNGEVPYEKSALNHVSDWEKNLIQRSFELNSKIQMLKNQWVQKGVTYKDVLLSQWQLGTEQTRYPQETIAKIGAHLINLMKQTAVLQIDKDTQKLVQEREGRKAVSEPVLKHEIVWTSVDNNKRNRKKLGVLSIHPLVSELIESNASHSLFARTYPMVYPPIEWKGYEKGGYLSYPSKAMRVYDGTDPSTLMKKADREGRLKQVFDALTVLGRTPWRINKDILIIVEKVWEQGGGKLALPSRQDLPIPEKLEPRFRLGESSGALLLTYDEETQLEAYHRNAATYRAKKKNAELHSLRCDVELKLATARKFLHEDRIYFPHNMDFRGRAYPIPPNLNHLGNDMCRGLLLFAEGRPLGPKGLDWLYIQIANLYGAGEDKKKLEDRLKFGMKSLDNILDSVERPLDGLQWWMDADSPWQLLATCIDIKNAVESENPEQYISHMHVHQDGSCNGLQHYAALGRDALGAAAVNLGKGDAPNDVYSEIAGVVQSIVSEDAKKGHRCAQRLHGHVDRKLVKQTVMTSVYGVTFIGARDQISNRLKERGWEDNSELFEVSYYAAKVTMAGLHKMFNSAKDVMHWLANCAQEIARANKTVAWTTPLGLPAAQPYRERDIKVVNTIMQRINLTVCNQKRPVMKRRQQTAFPPNYVHSLDSTHMMMTALGCYQKGVTFAGVHDSFWTHAASVDEMNAILREKFYALHSKPLLQELLLEFQKKYEDSDITFPEVPQQGDFDLREIFSAKYFFS